MVLTFESRGKEKIDTFPPSLNFFLKRVFSVKQKDYEPYLFQSNYSGVFATQISRSGVTWGENSLDLTQGAGQFCNIF